VVQKGSALLVVETESSALLKFMTQMQEALDNGTCPFTSIKVIANSDDVAESLFIAWEWRQVSLPKESHLDFAGEALTDAVSDMNIGMLKVAKSLADQRETEGPLAAKDSLDTMTQAFPRMLPSNERVAYFAENPDLTGLKTYLDMYAAPLNCTSCADEDVWPGSNVLDSLRWLAPLMP
jgi:hypothetical protein